MKDSRHLMGFGREAGWEPPGDPGVDGGPDDDYADEEGEEDSGSCGSVSTYSPNDEGDDEETETKPDPAFPPVIYLAIAAGGGWGFALGMVVGRWM